MRYRTLAGAFAACLIGMGPCVATAGPFADDMAKCLVKSTSESDRADLVRWIFAAMTMHPDLASMAKVSAQQREEVTSKATKLFGRLLFESCKSETVEAVRNEGPQTIQYAFEILGQVATRGLMTEPHVGQELQALGKGIDQEKLKQLVALAGKN